jgi:LPS-assembly protein
MLFFLFFAFLPQADAQVSFLEKLEALHGPIRVQADHVAYDKTEDSYVAEGKVEVWEGNRKLAADRVFLNARTSEAEATGNVILVQEEDVLHSESMKINLETNLGIIIQGSLFLKKQNFYLRGEELERVGEDTYRVRGGSFTTCEGDRPAWRFTGRETLVTLEEYASVWGATFQVKNIPLLYSPYLIFPVKTKRQSGFLIPRISYSNIGGVELNNAYFWAIAKNMDATFSLDLATTQGVGKGLEYRYMRQRDSRGSFYGYHIRETDQYRQKRTEQLDRKPDRWQLDLQHEEYFNQTFFAKGRIRGFSDRQYFKDYGFTYEDQSSEQAYSFISLTKNWERFSLFGEARHTVDLRQEDKTTLQNYPAVNFRGMRQPIPGSPFYFSMDSSYDYFWREQGVTGHRLDLNPRLSLPMRWGFFEITPDLGVRETVYRSQNGTAESHSRELWDFKTTVATEIFRIFETGSKRVPKLKHLVRPEISYTYVPDVDQRQIPDYDTAVPKSNAITYGITQRLIGKVEEAPGKIRYHEFAYCKLSQTYNLFEANQEVSPGSEPRRPFGLINVEARVKLLQYINAENITAYDPNKNRFLSSYTTADFSDFRGDGLHLEYTWAEGTQDQINGNLRIRILPSLDASYGKRYSWLDQQSLETVYGLHYRHQCWSVDLSYTERPAIAGQPAENKIMLLFTIVGVTSVGAR